MKNKTEHLRIGLLYSFKSFVIGSSINMISSVHLKEVINDYAFEKNYCRNNFNHSL